MVDYAHMLFLGPRRRPIRGLGRAARGDGRLTPGNSAKAASSHIAAGSAVLALWREDARAEWSTLFYRGVAQGGPNTRGSVALVYDGEEDVETVTAAVILAEPEGEIEVGARLGRTETERMLRKHNLENKVAPADGDDSDDAGSRQASPQPQASGSGSGRGRKRAASPADRPGQRGRKAGRTGHGGAASHVPGHLSRSAESISAELAATSALAAALRRREGREAVSSARPPSECGIATSAPVSAQVRTVLVICLFLCAASDTSHSLYLSPSLHHVVSLPLLTLTQAQAAAAVKAAAGSGVAPLVNYFFGRAGGGGNLGYGFTMLGVMQHQQQEEMKRRAEETRALESSRLAYRLTSARQKRAGMSRTPRAADSADSSSYSALFIPAVAQAVASLKRSSTSSSEASSGAPSRASPSDHLQGFASEMH